MEILDLRLLRPRDLEPLLEEEQQLWRSRLHWDFSNTAAWILRFMGNKGLVGYAVLKQDRPVGYSFFVYEDCKGLIGGLFVSEEFRNGAMESRLLSHVVETLQATPGIGRIEGQLILFSSEPVRHFFLSQEFRNYGRKFLSLSLADDVSLAPEDGSDLELLAWKPRSFPDAAQLITRAYCGHVDSQISDQYRSRAGAVRFLESMVRHAGCGAFQEECSFLAFRKGNGQPCGMVLTSLVQNRVAHITQLCVDPEFQGQGIGRRLMAQVLTTLRDRGFEAVTLTVTASNSGALHLYEQLRFSNLMDFDAFVWDAAPGKGFFPKRNP
ncbi:MAG: GNAT family N-acetyltransferase [Acidobacteria bacterium]|nr:GNAT family N-acetyltransferase [Acidobacteriota bacterium]